MTFAHSLTVLRARWVCAVLVFSVLMSAVVFKTFTEQRRYTADASVLIDAQTPDPVAGVTLQGMMSPNYMLTQVDVIKSLRVARKAARALDLLDDPALQQQWREATGGSSSMETWLAERLQQSLDANPSRGSNVINVSYTAADPKLAAAVTNAFVNSYVETTLELRIEPARQYNKFFEVHARQLRAKLEDAKAKLSSYQRSQGIIETDEKLDIENARLAELSSQLVAMQSLAAESVSRQGAARENPDQIQEVLSSGVIGALTSDLSRQEARLEELNSRLGDQHPQVLELQANIDKMRKRIEIETKRVSAGVSVANSVNRTRLASVRGSLEAQRAKVLEMKSRRDGAEVLQQDVANAQRAYEAVVARVSQTSLEGQTAQSNASVLEVAVPPSVASSPKVRTNLILGSLLSIAVALGTVALREHRDARLRLSDEVPALIGQQVIATIPPFKRSGRPLLMSVKRLGLATAKSRSRARL